MIITNPKTKAWLEHRYGSRFVPKTITRRTRGIEGNQAGAKFIDTFGKKQIRSFIGFVDLAQFSTRIRDKSPEEIAMYVRPFLNGVIKVISDSSGMIDKTIGDEVMFALPDPEEEGMLPASPLMRQILSGLYDLAFTLDEKYQYRIGLSYGEVVLDLIESDTFSEWTLYGETINIAKRILSVNKLAHPKPVIGAFGLKANDSAEAAKRSVTQMLEEMSEVAARWSQQPVVTIEQLKGVGDVACGYLEPMKN